MTKYERPEKAAIISQARRTPACILTVSTHPPTWNLEITKRSRKIFTATLTEPITSGTSGLSIARVALGTATSTAELRAEKALIRAYVIPVSWTLCGTNLDENSRAAPRNTMLSTAPRKAWTINRVCASPKRGLMVRASFLDGVVYQESTPEHIAPRGIMTHAWCLALKQGGTDHHTLWYSGADGVQSSYKVGQFHGPCMSLVTLARSVSMCQMQELRSTSSPPAY